MTRNGARAYIEAPIDLGKSARRIRKLGKLSGSVTWPLQNLQAFRKPVLGACGICGGLEELYRVDSESARPQESLLGSIQNLRRPERRFIGSLRDLRRAAKPIVSARRFCGDVEQRIFSEIKSCGGLIYAS
jgi:hypothetical protein